ncbi:COMM domain-containing protein [Podarcis lilfordi]|uniref:COMM domain-containing protein n=1 Tax=Podarcis lilfordi TaxID=74358 RepID=A0AA35KHT7_9SAUR|nr:COMM domain-containing protein [Podarcis lilfordi]
MRAFPRRKISRPGLLASNSVPGEPNRKRLRRQGRSAAGRSRAEAVVAAEEGERSGRAMGLLSFAREPVPETLSSDLQQLNQLSSQQFSTLAEVVFRFLQEPKEVERFLAQLSEFATSNKLSPGPLKNIVKSLLLVPNGALKRGLSAEQVRADLITLGLSEEKASYFEEQWKEKSPTLSRLAVGQTLMVNQLVDMEWKFGVTAGSSELEKAGSIFLQLKLVIRKGNKVEPLYMELTLPQFYSFLHEMERMKTSLECLS